MAERRSSQFNAQFTELMDRISTREQGNGAGTPSLLDPGNLDFRIPVAREIFGNGEGSDNGEKEFIQDLTPTYEKEIIDSKLLRDAKLKNRFPIFQQTLEYGTIH